MKKLYTVAFLVEEVKTSTEFYDPLTRSVESQKVKLMNKEEGVCGMFPVFTNKKKAEKFSEGKWEIITFEVKEKD